MTSPSDDWERHWHVYARAAERNPAQTYRRRLILEVLRAAGAGERILDVGSGTGALVAELRRAFPAAELVGLELSREGVQQARTAVPGATFVQRDLLGDSEVEAHLRGWATAAICSEVLEHLDEPGRMLKAIRAYLEPGCRLVVTVPGGPMSAFDRTIGHRRHFTPGSLRILLQEAGYRVQWTRGYGFPFFNLYRLVVIARGRRLTRDVDRDSSVATSAMRAFDRLLRLNVDRAPLGWQIVGLATLGE